MKQLSGFNNTGNVCIWPAEECLSIFCLENSQCFVGKSVIELGAGMTGLAGLIVANACKPNKVTLTDGNEVSVSNLKAIVQKNIFQNVQVDCKLLRWDVTADETSSEKFDVVICADCLFFDEGRPQLIKCLKQILNPSGVAFITAPSRSGTLENFVELINKETEHFKCPIKKELDYSERISLRKQELISCHSDEFDENVHYPILLRCEKIRKE